MSKKNVKFLDEDIVISDIKNIAYSLNKDYKSMLCLTNILYSLFCDYLSFDIERPYWINRDRFVLGDDRLSPLFYSLMFFIGNNYDINDMKNYGFLGNNMPFNLEYNINNNIDVSSFYHGGGLSTAVGFALGEVILSEKFNLKNVSLFDYYTYLVCTSSSLEDSFGYEALSIVNDYNLNKLVVICLNEDGRLSREKLMDTYLAMDFEVIYIKDLENEKEIRRIFNNLDKFNKPVFIIGDVFEIESLEGDFSFDEINTKLFKDEIKEKIKGSYSLWYENYRKFMTSSNEDDKEQLVGFLNNDPISLKLDKIIDVNKLDLNKSLFDLNQTFMSVINNFVSNFIGSSLYNNKKFMFGKTEIDKNDLFNCNLVFKNKSSVIGDVFNGLVLLGFRGVIQAKLMDVPKMISSIRHSAMMNIPVTYIFTSDTFLSQSLGGNSPLNEIGMLRSIHNLSVYRPCDYKELMGVWNIVLEDAKPAAIIISNDFCESYKYTSISEVSFGGYVISEVKNKLDLIILASGSDVNIAYKLKEELLKNYIEARVVSVPCLKKFISSDKEYLSQVLPRGYKRVAIELSNDCMWQSLLGNSDDFFGVFEYAKGGDDAEVLNFYGLDMASMVIKIKESL